MLDINIIREQPELVRQALLQRVERVAWDGAWYVRYYDWDGTPLSVRMLRFDNLAADWQALIRDWELPDMELGRVNSSGVAFERGRVSERSYGEIMDYCWRDGVGFGYG